MSRLLKLPGGHRGRIVWEKAAGGTFETFPRRLPDVKGDSTHVLQPGPSQDAEGMLLRADATNPLGNQRRAGEAEQAWR